MSRIERNRFWPQKESQGISSDRRSQLLVRFGLFSSRFSQSFIGLAQLFDLFVVEFLQVDQQVSRTFGDPDQLVQFNLERLSIAVLRALDQENHQEGDNGRACIDDELPCVAVVE